MKLFILVFVFLLSNTPLLAQKSTFVQTDKIEGVICTNFSEWSFLSKDKEFWTPAKEQVSEAEKEIEKYLKNNPPAESSDLWQNLSKYKRQYIGIIVNGHKRIYCNFFCWNEPLSERPVLVDDGGDCFFKIEYDVEDEKCDNLSINGNG